MGSRHTKHVEGAPRALRKSPTGIVGLDQITGGGLPWGRPALVCGGTGCGKTLLAMEFIVRGAMQFDEPGVFVSFEETTEELAKNVRSLGFDLDELVRKKKLAMDFVRVERSEIEETGEYDLEGLFVRLNYAIDSIGAKRVVLDTIEALFSGLSNTAILRAELRRLFRWLKDKGVTTIITGEKGEGGLTRQGIEEYVSDCVIALDHRVNDQLSTRRLRIVKYRGSTHGTNEYPFLITEHGISLAPITSLGLTHMVSTERVSTGVDRLDAMLDGLGYYRGSTVLVSGSAGTGKSSLAAHFVDGACRRGERCLYLAMEESQNQILRNMRSIGIELGRHITKGLLKIDATRPTYFGLEMHLASIHLLVEEFRPAVLVLDPATNLISSNGGNDVHEMLMRLVDYLKSKGITSMITTLAAGGKSPEQTDVAISSLIDTWILLKEIESSGERNRGLYILKSRGMAHSNQIREYRLTAHGMQLEDVYVGPGGVLTGSARLAQEAREHADEFARQQFAQRQAIEREAERKALESQIAVLQAKLAIHQQESQAQSIDEQERRRQLGVDQGTMARIRQADAPAEAGAQGKRKRGSR